ncbi:MAG: sigma-70 family RNA polymerase sigma factor [Candidatus Aminicenantes bacterium]|nr:sigma-70 family RNA polymerase sigma factor [Candidatus Aminicenantes bacterium]
MDEKQLILSCLEGEAEAFREMVDTYKTKAMALALNMLGNREDAEDACQETFIRVYSNLNKFDLQSPFRNWFYTILSNKCLDLLRKRRRFFSFIKKMKEEYAENTNTQSSASSQNQPLGPKILEGLSPKERVALCLWASEGYSGTEIAQVMNCSSSTARVLLYKARKKIKSKMEKENVSLSNS